MMSVGSIRSPGQKGKGRKEMPVPKPVGTRLVEAGPCGTWHSPGTRRQGTPLWTPVRDRAPKQRGSVEERPCLFFLLGGLLSPNWKAVTEGARMTHSSGSASWMLSMPHTGPCREDQWSFNEYDCQFRMYLNFLKEFIIC